MCIVPKDTQDNSNPNHLHNYLSTNLALISPHVQVIYDNIENVLKMMIVVEQVVVVNKSMMVDHYSSMNNEYEAR